MLYYKFCILNDYELSAMWLAVKFEKSLYLSGHSSQKHCQEFCTCGLCLLLIQVLLLIQGQAECVCIKNFTKTLDKHSEIIKMAPNFLLLSGQ